MSTDPLCIICLAPGPKHALPAVGGRVVSRDFPAWRLRGERWVAACGSCLARWQVGGVPVADGRYLTQGTLIEGDGI